MKPKVIVVCGPTATGKSDYAVKLAKKIDGEIISADSRQVYKDLNIGTGKITKREMSGVAHYLLDVASPKRQFSVARYKKLGEHAIRDILKRGKTPIICGGTGFYIDTLLGLELPEVKPNLALRKELSDVSLQKLFEKLKKIDPDRAKTIDKKNKVRLIRALEIAHSLGKVPKIKKQKLYGVEWIGLSFQSEALKKRIHDRLLKRIKLGMIREAQKLHTEGLSFRRMEALGLEYKYLAYYLQKKLTKQQMIAQLETAIWHYAKRQMTWFKRNKEIKWIKN